MLFSILYGHITVPLARKELLSVELRARNMLYVLFRMPVGSALQN